MDSSLKNLPNQTIPKDQISQVDIDCPIPLDPGKRYQILYPNGFPPDRIIPRFPMSTNSIKEAKRYLQNRAIQMMAHGANFTLTGFHQIEDWGVAATFQLDKPLKVKHAIEPVSTLESVYILDKHRGKKNFSTYCLKNIQTKTFVTIPDCHIEGFFSKFSIPYVVFKPIQWPEYKAIEKFYGDKCARRTGVSLMNHIDEGIFVLRLLGSSDTTMKAYALHPLFQGDIELKLTLKDIDITQFDPLSIVYAMEYRRVANAYLSFHPRTWIPYTSPIPQVNQMLIADKVQNCKDFQLFHQGKLANSDRLDEYFAVWLKTLGISTKKYLNFKTDIMKRECCPLIIGDDDYTPE